MKLPFEYLGPWRELNPWPLILRELHVEYIQADSKDTQKTIKLYIKSTYIANYSGILIFRTAKGSGNWFEKSGVRNIEGGIKSHLFYRGIVL